MSQNYGYNPNQTPQTPGQVPPQQADPLQGNPTGYQNPYAHYGTGFGAGQGMNLSKPRPHVSYAEAHRNWFKYMFHFSGRASRSEYWWVQLTLGLILTTLIVLTVVLFLSAALSTDADGNLTDSGAGALVSSFILYLLIFVVALAISIMTLALNWRRMQDAGFPGWITLLNFFGLSIVTTIIAIFPSKPEGYQYDGPQDYDRP